MRTAPRGSPAGAQPPRRLRVFLPADSGDGKRGVPAWRHLPHNPFVFHGGSPADGATTTPLHATKITDQPPLHGLGRQDSGESRQKWARALSSIGAASGAVVGIAPTTAASSPDSALRHCDACQKSFKTQEAYDAHMARHVYCTVPGCRFTCRSDKAWKMEAHMDTLHNRPDAPMLADAEQYLRQRRGRFPTQENVLQKVEELYYKAARGAVMPDERRRWMRQHGILIGKRFRTEQTYIARGRLPRAATEAESAADGARADAPLHEEGDDAPEVGFSSAGSDPSSGSDSRSSSRSSSLSSSRIEQGGKVGAPGAPVESPVPTPRLAAAETPAPAARVSASLVERVQQQQQQRRIPRYYVCNRCGSKGDHWVGDCPTRGDATYDRHARDGVQRGPPGSTGTVSPAAVHECAARTQDAPSAPREPTEDDSSAGCGGSPTDQTNAQPPPAPDAAVAVADTVTDADIAPPPVSARRLEPSAESSAGASATGTDKRPNTTPPRGTVREVTRMIAPVAAARLAGRGRGYHAGPRHAPGGPGADAPVTTLYERLTEEDRLNEDGLLLQAIRFFIARDFFES